MTKSYIFICWGDSSGIGKDKTADIISSFIPCTKIKFNRHIKTPMENWLCIPEGSLDDKAFRKQRVTNPVTGKLELFTYEEVLYNSFHHFKNIYPTGENWLIPGAAKKQILNTPGNIAIVDCRNQTEVESLRQLQSKYYIVFLHIFSDRGEQKSTDKDIKADDFKFADFHFSIRNNKDVTLENIEIQVYNVLYFLKLVN